MSSCLELEFEEELHFLWVVFIFADEASCVAILDDIYGKRVIKKRKKSLVYFEMHVDK